MLTYKQEVYALVRPIADQRAFLFQEEAQTAWQHAYQMRYEQAQMETTLFLQQFISNPELGTDQEFEQEIEKTFEEIGYDSEEEI